MIGENEVCIKELLDKLYTSEAENEFQGRLLGEVNRSTAKQCKL